MLNPKKMKFQILIILLALAATLASAAGPLTIGELTDILNDLNSIKDQPNYLYRVLNLPATAGLHQIRKSHHELTLVFHPDQYRDDESSEEVATELMKRLNHAFETLSDEYKRAEYDSQNNANTGHDLNVGVPSAGRLEVIQNTPELELNSPDQPEKDLELNMAAKDGNFGLVKKYLDAGANINNGRGLPLNLAIENGHVSIVQLLIGRHATVNIGKAGETPLSVAVVFKSTEIVPILLDAGADVSAHNYDALIWAMKFSENSREFEEIETMLKKNVRSKLGALDYLFLMRSLEQKIYE